MYDPVVGPECYLRPVAVILSSHTLRHYSERAGNIYNRSDVEVIESEGRSFISRTERKFDVIFMGFVDTWASVASGGLSLSENYLYTAQAFEAYYDHLTENGVLAIMRW